jgi:hypothetical protein
MRDHHTEGKRPAAVSQLVRGRGFGSMIAESVNFARS